MNYWEYVKERWSDIVIAFIHFLPLAGLIGWLAPFAVFAFAYPFAPSTSVICGVIGGVWFGIVAIYILVKCELDNYRGWKECYAFNHKKEPSVCESSTVKDKGEP